jgi:hypothetical protein
MRASATEVLMSLARLAAAAVVAAALVSSASADDEPAPLKFAWPVPSKVTVTEKMLRAGHTVTTKYTVSLERSGESGDSRVHPSDFEFTEVDGKPSTDPSVAPIVTAMMPVTKSIPDLLIGADGAVKDVIGLDNTITIMIEEMTKNVDERHKAQISALRAQFDSPAMREQMKRDAAKNWTAWVANWSGRVIPEGKGVEGTWPVSFPDGVAVTAPTRYRRMPAEDEGPGLVKLTRESTLDGEDSQAPFEEFLARAEAAAGRPLGATGMRLVDRVAVVTDPATLRPTWVRREELRVIHLKGVADRSDIERHEYTFAWPAAEKPKPVEPTAPSAPVQPVEPVKPAEGGK